MALTYTISGLYYHVSIVLYVSNLAYSLQQTICRLVAMASVYLTREEIFNCTLEIASGGGSVSFLFFKVRSVDDEILALDLLELSWL